MNDEFPSLDAFREEYRAEDLDADALKRQIMRRLPAPAPARPWRLGAKSPVTYVLVASVAAATTGVIIGAHSRDARVRGSAAPASAQKYAPRARAVESAPLERAAPAPSSVEPGSPETPAPATSAAPRPSRRPHAGSSASPVEEAPPVVPSAVAPAPAPAASAVTETDAGPDPDLALYRKAHELHFHEASAARALAAWEEYLKAFPHGTFAPEARFNRAICLLRLGWHERARLELEKIAENPSGPFAREAQSILAGPGW